MNSIYKARSSCPICSQEEEVWIYKGEVQPLDIVECPKCSNIYQANEFITQFIDLRQNITISSNFAAYHSTAELLLP